MKQRIAHWAPDVVAMWLLFMPLILSMWGVRL